MQEVLDVIDEHDEVVGRAPRSECHRKMLRHRAIQVFVFDEQGNIFVQRRSKSKDSYPGMLEASCAGHVQSGEAYRQAAARELAEELGITHREHELQELFRFKLRAAPEHELVAQFSIRCTCTGKLQKGEVESGGFVPWNEFVARLEKNPQEFTPATVAAVQLYQKDAGARTAAD
jgi:isopentenyl-diphosphate delta-isomerase type 1